MHSGPGRPVRGRLVAFTPALLVSSDFRLRIPWQVRSQKVSILMQVDKVLQQKMRAAAAGQQQQAAGAAAVET